jgi:glutathione S-transferase
VKLIGMLDSPYVRRVAISLQLLGLPFEHASVSVFRGFEAFRRINPVVKAPTLVCDDGEVLMDSNLILAYAEELARPRSLWPAEVRALQRHLRLTGLALAGLEKSVQIVYEHELRPAEKLHQPWLDRVTGQLLAAYGALEAELARRPLDVSAAGIGHAGVAVAVAWHYTQQLLPQVVPAAGFPHLAALSSTAETLPAFRAAPHGESVCRSGASVA